MNKAKYSHTCIAVLKDKKGKLVMAGDRRIIVGDTNYQTSDRAKVIKRDGLLLGGSGLGFLCDIVCNIMPLPKKSQVKDTLKYIHTKFFPAVSEYISDLDLNATSKSSTEEMSSSIVIGVNGDLFELVIDSNFGIVVDPVTTPYAIGCASDFALGSLRTQLRMGETDTEKMLRIALEVAAEHSTGCDTNIDIIRE